MVHSWIHLKNNNITDTCMNSRVKRIFNNPHTFFYGDYDLDVYIGQKDTYHSLQTVVRKVIKKHNGWISCCSVANELVGDYSSLSQIIGEFGNIHYTQLHKLFPRKETSVLKQTLVYRKDSNFKMIACETDKFYYVFCFATS